MSRVCNEDESLVQALKLNAKPSLCPLLSLLSKPLATSTPSAYVLTSFYEALSLDPIQVELQSILQAKPVGVVVALLTHNVLSYRG
jgi:hypothetical protein